MGMRRRWSDDGGTPIPGDPDPERFTIVSTERIGRLHLSVLRYEGCTNFEGRKVLLTEWSPQDRMVIDPHFAQGSGILARFEPTGEGIAAGRLLAEALSGDGIDLAAAKVVHP